MSLASLGPGYATAEFPPTRYSLLERARGDGPGAAAAAVDLIGVCRAPVFGHLWRRCARAGGRPDARQIEELTDDFLTHFFVEGRGLHLYQRRGGRFRSYVTRAAAHFAVDRHRFETAPIRGGGRVLSLDALREDDRTFDVVDPDGERDWDNSFLAHAFTRLDEKYARHRSPEIRARYLALRRHHWAVGPHQEKTLAEIATALNTPLGTLRVFLHRLRKELKVLLQDLDPDFAG